MMSCDKMDMAEMNMQTNMKMGSLASVLFTKGSAQRHSQSAISASCAESATNETSQESVQAAHQSCQQCTCTLLSCTSPVVVQQLHSYTPILLLVNRLSSATLAISSPINPTLYRPPISHFI